MQLALGTAAPGPHDHRDRASAVHGARCRPGRGDGRWPRGRAGNVTHVAGAEMGVYARLVRSQALVIGLVRSTAVVVSR